MMSEKIIKAAEFAKNAHESIDQRRKYSNEPYIVHPEAVAELVTTVTDDVEMICAAWLHDVVEDTPISLTEIHSHFGAGIGELVDDLTDPAQRADGNRATRIAINYKHTAQASVRAKTVKLADVIHNLTGIVECDPNFAWKFVQEKKQLLEVLNAGDQSLFKLADAMVKDCVIKLERMK
jgi:(p)ppGpp synthase/HD superfamily hydrolase